jgi:hypothetical protein
VADASLTRIRELSPDEGRQLLLDELRSGDHRVTYAVLADLPDTVLPELDDTLFFRLQRQPSDRSRAGIERSLVRWLIARYGSAAFLPITRAAIAGGRCQSAGPELVHVSKHDAAGARLLAACDVMPFPEIESRYWDERFEAEALSRLAGNAVDQVSTAAQALGRRGSPAAKAPLLDRLKRWHEEWRGRMDEMTRESWPSGRQPLRIESSIVGALLQNRGFALTAPEMAVVRSLCLTDGCRRMVDQYTRR